MYIHYILVSSECDERFAKNRGGGNVDMKITQAEQFDL